MLYGVMLYEWSFIQGVRGTCYMRSGPLYKELGVHVI